ncbi:MAG: ABC transporter substrate-binding protein [Actinobacteria bacterium]|nr:ABC transporter substrate-binding protein [Actinomycetota bacterium]MSX03418.1 ABC transporter substrate-binding protein [Actinomycetota bacterium]MSX83635.1 ABC transporter substrate-binding protein [Actinomycetota bacterium]MSY96272.1 ABC transporter substrate-binding protein [Actinomycetota bacterium]MUH54303.1 ABC transporter substrate-binding protein [Actinomycetota bacterium]
MYPTSEEGRASREIYFSFCPSFLPQILLREFFMFKNRSSLVLRIFATTIALSVVGLTPTSAANSKPQRIISLSPSATETLFAIGAGPQVIAVDDLSNFPTNAPISKLSAFSSNVEALLNYRPDLIILNADATKAIEVKAALEKLKIKVFLEKAPKDLSQVYLEITALGRATGNLTSAQTVVTTMKSKIRAAIKSGRQAKKISFFHELDNTLYTATSDTFIGKVYKDFNLTNVADPAASADSAGYPQLQSEYLIKSNPRIIFLSDAQYGESLATLMKRPGWNGISAVSKKSVIALPEDIPSRWGPRLVDFYEFIAAAIGKIK